MAPTFSKVASDWYQELERIFNPQPSYSHKRCVQLYQPSKSGYKKAKSCFLDLKLESLASYNKKEDAAAKKSSKIDFKYYLKEIVPLGISLLALGLVAKASPVLAISAMPMIALPPVKLGMPPPPRVMTLGQLPPQSEAAYMPPQESFAELIFPGFDSGSFIWGITAWQICQFIGSMALGQQHAAPSTCALYSLGASWGPAVASGGIWRLVSPIFLHANMMHLFFNVFFQLRIGFGMEKQFGRKKFVLLYLLCGILGNLFSIALDPFKLAVGASTAGFGLIGVWLAEILLSWHMIGPNRDRTIYWILFMLGAVIMMSSVAPNIDMFGHLGGAVAGFLVSILLANMPESARPSWYNTAKKCAAAVLFGTVAAAAVKVALFTPRQPLPNCQSIFGALKHTVGLR